MVKNDISMKQPKNIHSLAKSEDLEDDLHEAVIRKMSEMEKLFGKVEKLKWNLIQVKTQFMQRVGRLYILKDKLDFAINKFKQIEIMMKKGISYKEAVVITSKREDDFRTNSKYRQEYIFLKEELKKESKEDMQKIKNLYRKLTIKYHPDLVKDPAEKKSREKVMKKIIKAYKESDLQELTNIYEEQITYNSKDHSVDFLKKKLTDCMSKIIQLETEYKDLIQGQWFIWMKKIDLAKKRNLDPFKDLETSLLEDIEKRKMIIKEFKLKYEKQIN